MADHVSGIDARYAIVAMATIHPGMFVALHPVDETGIIHTSLETNVGIIHQGTCHGDELETVVQDLLDLIPCDQATHVDQRHV